MRDIDAAEDWLDSWVASVDTRAAYAVELSRRVAALTGEASSSDGHLRVRVGASGRLEQLDIDDRARQRTGADLSRDIMALIGRAQARLAEQVADQVRDTVGADSETGRAVMDAYAGRFTSSGT